MASDGIIEHRWYGSGRGRYVLLRPVRQPTERDWTEATRKLLADHDSDSVALIVDTCGYPPVMTRAGFDEMIKDLKARGLKHSTVAIVMEDPNYEYVARMFEASSDAYGFDLRMSVFKDVEAAIQWLISAIER